MKKKTARKKQTKKKSFDILSEYRKSWEYIKQSRRFIYFVAGIFFFFFLLGFFIPAPEFIYNEIVKFINGIIAETQNLSPLDLISFIISNNVQSALFDIVFGVVLGIFPLLSTVANGYLLGFVSSLSVNTSGLSSLLKLFPHGIFELPALFLSLGLGLRIGMFIFKKDKMNSLKSCFLNSLRIFLLVIIPLLVIAGIIEGALIFLIK